MAVAVIVFMAVSNGGRDEDSDRDSAASNPTTSQANALKPVSTYVATTTEQTFAPGTSLPGSWEQPPVVNRYLAGDFELTLSDGKLVQLWGPVERQVTEMKTVETGRSYRIGAICRDGWRSYATGRGACSWHGGVDYWLVTRETKQVSEVSTVVTIETICRDNACPDLEGPRASSNVKAAARYVAVVNDVFDLNVPSRELAKASLDPDEVAASSLVSKSTLDWRELMR